MCDEAALALGDGARSAARGTPGAGLGGRARRRVRLRRRPEEHAHEAARAAHDEQSEPEVAEHLER